MKIINAEWYTAQLQIQMKTHVRAGSASKSLWRANYHQMWYCPSIMIHQNEWVKQSKQLKFNKLITTIAHGQTRKTELQNKTVYIFTVSLVTNAGRAINNPNFCLTGPAHKSIMLSPE